MSRFVLIGHPVGQSLSPAIHRAAYACLGFSHDYELIDAPDAKAVRTQVQALRKGEIAGANITVPHKRLALTLADELDPSAERVGAANVLAKSSGGAVVAYNTDALGLAHVLEDFSPGVQRALVIGNGGAALASVVACQKLGVAEVLVTARAFRSDVKPGAWPHAEQFRRLGAEALTWLGSPAQDPASIAGCGLLLQATSAGMRGKDGGEDLARVVPWAELRADARAYDLVYNPPLTPFLRAARERGLQAEGGLSMLVAQAQLAVEIWLGHLPPRAPLMRAAERALEAFA